MYIFKNAAKCIGRSLGRNILIGIIAVVISASACIGLSIRKAAADAKEEGLEGLSVTAQITMDMKNMMKPEENGEFNREDFADRFENMSVLTLEELETYAAAESVKDFYYTATLSLNGSESFEAVSASSEDGASNPFAQGGMGGFGGKGGGMGGMPQITSADFSVIGYSTDDAMTSFINGTTSVTEGECFAEGTEELNCIISSELATYNSLSVGNRITLLNPDNEADAFTLTVVGIYEDENSGGEATFMGRGSSANQIYMSAAAVKALEKQSATVDEENAVSSTVSGTYVFEDVESYEKFEAQARELGLGEDYTVTSSDITAYEQSLVPLETLSTFAKYFLIVVLIIGAVILVVLNLFNIRERKYEVGVLTAIGMKKSRVALQFMSEIFIVMMASVIVGASIGAVTSVPVANALLENQVTSQSAASDRRNEAFARPEGMGDMGGMGENAPPEAPEGSSGGMKEMFGNVRDGATQFATEITASTDLSVLLQLMLIAIGLTVISGAVSVVFIMRYDPLRILANRD